MLFSPRRTRRTRSAAVSASPVATASRQRLILAVVVAAAVMDQLDNTIVNVAAPSVRADIGGGAATIQWLVAGYTLAFAVLLITGGRLGDLYGRRRMFLLGAAGFTIASVLCGVAASPGELITARVLQGAFGALLIPQGLGIIRAVFAPDRLGAAYGAFAPAMGLASVAGPTLAGALIGIDLHGLGWRTIFLINVPLGLACIVGATRLMPGDGDHDRRVSDRGLDLVGTALVTLAALLVVYPLIQGRAAGWPAWTFAMLAAGLLTFAGFVAYERITPRLPVVEPSLLRDRVFAAGLVVAVTFFGAIAGFFLVFTLFAQSTLGFSPLHAGLTGLPLSIGIAVAAAGSRSLADRHGRRVLHGGLLLMTIGLLALAITVAHYELTTTTWTLVPATLLTGAGMGLVFGPLFATILGGIADHEAGSAAGTLSAVQQLGGALGTAAMSTLFFALAGAGDDATVAMTTTTVVAAATTTGAFLLVFLLPAQDARGPRG